MKKNVKLWAMIGLPFLLASCMAGTEDLYNPSKADELLKSEYSAKFIAKYGEIAADYSWDATLAYPKYQSTRALIPGEKWYQVDNNTLSWLNEKLPEEKDNRKKGKPFALQVPRNQFTIVPIYQGKAGLEWEFHMVIGDETNAEDITVWKKSQDIQYKKSGDRNWKNVKDLGVGTLQNTIGTVAVRAKEYTYNFSDRAGELMYFYLLITKEVDGGAYAKKGTQQSSLDYKMLALTDCPRPDNIDQENEVMIIGCEDSNIEKDTDNDMNDVVFLIYGDPKIPQPIEIIGEEIKEVRSKRYMIEDLGSTDDFDFNDIVVDVTQEIVKKLTRENGVLVSTEEVSKTQKATLRHLGGTIPFRLKIGDKVFDEMEGQMNVDFADEYEITGWNPDENNISVAVRGANNGDIHELEFPSAGEAPMIIAVDPSVDWMEERVSITQEWFETAKQQSK
ncbi:hypothetical protein [Bacteroides sp.]|uniref:hypothetical protein n=1 Tax=Bacteroides sp. TaxID=29523 RepID=UPI003AB2B819